MIYNGQMNDVSDRHRCRCVGVKIGGVDGATPPKYADAVVEGRPTNDLFTAFSLWNDGRPVQRTLSTAAAAPTAV